MADQGDVPALRVGALTRRLVRAVAERTRAELAGSGFADLRPVHNVVFAQLTRGGARITDMAARVGITKQAVTLLVDHLEAGGYVARVADPSDGRAKLVELTDRGRAAANASLAIVEGIDRDWTARLGAQRLAELKATLWELVVSLEPPTTHRGATGTHPGGPAAAG